MKHFGSFLMLHDGDRDDCTECQAAMEAAKPTAEEKAAAVAALRALKDQP